MKAKQQKSNQNVNEIAGLSQTTVWQRHAITEAESDLLAEEVPVALVYNGISHVVMMATPENLEWLSRSVFPSPKALLSNPAEIYGMDVVPACNGLEVQIELSSRRFMGLKARRRALAGRTGCGVCGVEQLDQIGKPVAAAAVHADL